MTANCRWDRDAEAYLTPEGEPCKVDDYGDPTRHCTAKRSCSWHVGPNELTCGRCLAGARTSLRWIGDLSGLLLTQALTDGVMSEAANLAGPATDPRAWAGVQLAQRRYLTTWLLAERITEQQAVHAIGSLEEDDKRHGERLITTWARMIAEDYEHPLPERMTLSWCVGYLDRQLHRIAQDPEQDFPLLRRELKKCRHHLEAVLHNDDQHDRGAPCPECVANEDGVPRLVRDYAHGVKHDRYDQWRCPRNPEHVWSHHAYVAYAEGRKHGAPKTATPANG